METGQEADRQEWWSDLFSGALEPYRETLVLEAPERPGVPAAELLDAERFDRLVAPFVERHREADRRAVVSLWSQWYFAALVVPSVGMILRTGRQLPLAVGEVEVLLAEEDHRPTGFQLPHGGRPPSETAEGRPSGTSAGSGESAGSAEPAPTAAPDDPFAPFRVLVWGHLEPLIETVAPRSGLSTGLLWSNAGTCFDWAVHELGAPQGPGGHRRARLGRRFLRTRTWPDGRENPLHEPIVRRDGCADAPGHRRICCLRYLVPGFERCGERCPLPD